MKIVTQKDFQNLYKSPGTEETAEMNQTLANLPEKKSPERLPVIRRRRLVFILAALMVMIGVAAVATGFLRETIVSWDAKPTETEAPMSALTGGDWASIQELLKTYSKDEMVVVNKKDTNEYFHNDTGLSVSSEAELMQVLGDAGYPHPAKLVPDGWEFHAAQGYRDNTPEGKNELIEESESADGKYIIKRYSIDQQHQVVTGYTIILKKGEKDGLITSSAIAKDDISRLSVSYPSDGDMHAEKLDIPGMEGALFTNYKDISSLDMYRPLEKPLEVSTDLYGFVKRLQTKDYEMIACQDLTPEEVTSLFAETE